MSWFRRFIKKRGLNPSKDTNMATTTSGTITVSMPPTDNSHIFESYITSVGAGGAGGAMTSAVPSTVYSIGSTVVSSGVAYPPSSGYINLTGGIAGGTFTTFTTPVPSSLLTLSTAGKEILSVKPDGSVKWAGDINIDEAAEAFARSLSMGSEIAAGITKKVKLEMRDSVFEDLISIAKDKGSLTAEDLEYLLQASKIVEKLRGGRE